MTAFTRKLGTIVYCGEALTISWSTISSQLTTTRLLARHAQDTEPRAPQYWAFPNLSARCTCTMQTFGLAAGTTGTSRSVKGHLTTPNLPSPIKSRTLNTSEAMIPGSTGINE